MLEAKHETDSSTLYCTSTMHIQDDPTLNQQPCQTYCMCARCTFEVVSVTPCATSRTSPTTSGEVVIRPVTPDAMSLKRPTGFPRKSTEPSMVKAWFLMHYKNTIMALQQSIRVLYTVRNLRRTIKEGLGSPCIIMKPQTDKAHKRRFSGNRHYACTV